LPVVRREDRDGHEAAGRRRDVRVNCQQQTLTLSLDEAATPRATVEEGIRKLGYGVAPLEAPRVLTNNGQRAEPAPSAAPAWWRGSKARLAAAIGALVAGGFVVLFTAGELLEGFAGSRARAGIETLGAPVPRTAMLIKGGTAREMPAATRP